MATGQAWEQFNMDIAERMILCAKIIEEKCPGYSVMGYDERIGKLRRIRFADVDLDRDKYIMKIKPTSYLPTLKAFRIAAVKEILEVAPQAQPYALKMLAFPDTEAIQKRLDAPMDVIEMTINQILYAKYDEDILDIYQPPDAFTDPNQALLIANGEYARAKIDGVPEERLELLRRYMGDCEALIQKAKEAAMQEAAAMQGPPPGVAAPELPPPGAPPGGGLRDININPDISVQAPMPIPGM